jgi:hypothetical protein
MGNAAIFYPGDEPTPCWTCIHFIGLHTQSIGNTPADGHLACTVTCAQRGRYCFTDPDAGCRYHQLDDASPNVADR